MRTTLTLDKDVAAMLERLRKARGGKLKDLVNEALRQGLRQAAGPPKRRADFRTRSTDLGTCRLGNVDNVAEILAVVEGESSERSCSTPISWSTLTLPRLHSTSVPVHGLTRS